MKFIKSFRFNNKENSHRMPKNPGLKLFTKIGSIKDEEKNCRPLTATLEKPAVLDVKFMRRIDMSRIRKELLNITNLCRFSLRIVDENRRIQSLNLSLSDGEIEEKKMKMVKPKLLKPTNNKVSRLKYSYSKRSISTAVLNDSNNNNNNNNKSNVKKLSVQVVKNVPGPCKTCGRSNLPERFHSHPDTPLKPLKRDEIIPEKNTVQKPIAIRYKSRKAMTPVQKPLPLRKPSLPSQVLEHTPPETPKTLEGIKPMENSSSNSNSRIASAKRTLSCYICGREFGTASFPLHEPKCLKKWEDENRNLPEPLRRSAPIKPDPNVPAEEWNRKALEIFKSKLLPCSNCGRTFNPDSLQVHQKSCTNKEITRTKTQDSELPRSPLSQECQICKRKFSLHSIKIHEKQCLKIQQTQEVKNETNSRPTSERKLRVLPCYICGKMFSTASIGIHEPQCMKMWKLENEKLPSSKRRKEPIRPEIKLNDDGKMDFKAASEEYWKSHLRQLVPCKNCSRTFNPDRVEIHERNCKG